MRGFCAAKCTFLPGNHSDIHEQSRQRINILMTATNASLMFRLRLKCAVNHFKHRMLGAAHKPGISQGKSVLIHMTDVLSRAPFDPRTWDSWFVDAPPRVQRAAIGRLDQFIDAQGGRLRDRRGEIGFYEELVFGGLVEQALSSDTGKLHRSLVAHRISNYRPRSPLHLHFDALDVAELENNRLHGGGCLWESKTMLANRVMECLHDRWNHRCGTVYETLSSDMKLAMLELSEVDRRSADKQFTFGPMAFQFLMGKAPQPMFEARLNQLDFSASQVHKTLFGIAADTSFLRADRLIAWSLDSATAALALQSMNWRFQQDMLDSGRAIVMPEVWYLDAMQSLFFGLDDEEALSEALGRVNELGQFNWLPDTYHALLAARDQYHALLFQMGLDHETLWKIAEFFDRSQPATMRKA